MITELTPEQEARLEELYAAMAAADDKSDEEFFAAVAEKDAFLESLKNGED